MDSIITERMKAVRGTPGLLSGSAARPPAAEVPHRDLRGFEVLELPSSPRDPESGLLLARFAGVGERFTRALEDLVVEAATACWRCGTPVGATVAGAPAPGGIVRWEFVALVARVGQGPVSVQCEACAPDVAPEPWPVGAAPSVLLGELVECRPAPGGVRTVHVTTPGGTSCRCGALSPTAPPAPARSAE